jgi:hypothetical protein
MYSSHFLLGGCNYLDLKKYKAIIQEESNQRMSTDTDCNNSLKSLLERAITALIVWLLCMFVAILPILVLSKTSIFANKDLYYLCVTATCLPLTELLLKEKTLNKIIFKSALVVCMLIM